jgi:2-amino-4-hydroxy-6-hydroxymethyldihydropteridine diphosphokinase
VREHDSAAVKKLPQGDPEPRATAAIALGSNLPSPFGDPAANLREALHRLEDLGHVAAVSSFHHTEPVGLTQQPRFVNAAALLETTHSPLDLLHGLLSIERAMGRVRSADAPPKGPRILDLDLLLYETKEGETEEGGSLVLRDPELTLPHPAMHERRFVLAPLAEIAPAMRHPRLNGTIADLLAELPAAS